MEKSGSSKNPNSNNLSNINVFNLLKSYKPSVAAGLTGRDKRSVKSRVSDGKKRSKDGKQGRIQKSQFIGKANEDGVLLQSPSISNSYPILKDRKSLSTNSEWSSESADSLSSKTERVSESSESSQSSISISSSLSQSPSDSRQTSIRSQMTRKFEKSKLITSTLRVFKTGVKNRRSVGSNQDGASCKNLIYEKASRCWFFWLLWFQKSKRRKRTLADWDMRTSSISGASEQGDVHTNGQRDSEWLQPSLSSGTLTGLNLKKKTLKPPVKNSSKGPGEFIRIMMPLFKLMQFMGRFPIQISTEPHGTVTFRRVHKSSTYWTFFLTSFFLWMATCSIILHTILLSRPFRTTYQQILILEFDKYWVEVVLMALCLLVLTISNSVLLFGGGGIILEDFLNRWILSLNLLQYDVTYGLKKLLRASAFLYITYAFTFTLLFFVGGNEFPTCRGSSGTIVLFMIDHSFRDIRLTEFYTYLEYFGLLFNLYVTLASGLILTFIMAYCWALSNAASQFNLKLASSIQKSRQNSKSTGKQTIQFTDLFEAHLVANSFARQFGTVFSITFQAFICTKIFGCLVSLYNLVLPFISAFPNYEDTFLDITTLEYVNVEKVVPIRNQEPAYCILIKSLYYTLENFIITWVVLEVIYRPGSIIMEGERYIVKQGLIKCSDSNERKFISSMIYSFSPRIPCTLRSGFSMDRKFIAKFFGVILSIALTMIQFNPVRTDIHVKLVCDKVGVCTEIAYVGQLDIKDFIPHERTPQPPTSSSTTTEVTRTFANSTNVTTERPRPVLPQVDHKGRVVNLPCSNERSGIQSVIIEDIVHRCGPNVYLPVVYYEIERGYAKVPVPCVQTGPLRFPVSVQNVYDCYGTHLPWSTRNPVYNSRALETDDCFNVKANLPSNFTSLEKKNPSELELLVFKDHTGLDILCCYKYTGLSSTNPRCNLKSPTDRHRLCKKKELLIPNVREKLEIAHKTGETFIADQTFQTYMHYCICLNDQTSCEHLERVYVRSTRGARMTSRNIATNTLPRPTVPQIDDKVSVVTFPCVDERKQPAIIEDIVHRCGSNLYLPVVYYEIDGGYTKVPVPCEKNAPLRFPVSVQNVYDCYGTHLQWSTRNSVPNRRTLETDDCFNVKANLPSSLTSLKTRNPSRLELLVFEDHTGLDILCCYKYTGFSSTNPRCNLKSPADRHRLCRKKTLPIHDLRKRLERAVQNGKISRSSITFEYDMHSCICYDDLSRCQNLNRLYP